MASTKGIGYQDYISFRRLNENFINCAAMEAAGNERYVIYFGRAYVKDFETGVVARGPLKIGRGKFATALMRGRNQPGIDFRIYAEIVLDNNQATYDCEAILKDALSHRNIVGSQGQKELYDIKDRELKKTVQTIVEILEAETPHKILDIIFFSKNSYTSIAKNKKRKPKVFGLLKFI